MEYFRIYLYLALVGLRVKAGEEAILALVEELDGLGRGLAVGCWLLPHGDAIVLPKLLHNALALCLIHTLGPVVEHIYLIAGIIVVKHVVLHVLLLISAPVRKGDALVVVGFVMLHLVYRCLYLLRGGDPFPRADVFALLVYRRASLAKVSFKLKFIQIFEVFFRFQGVKLLVHMFFKEPLWVLRGGPHRDCYKGPHLGVFLRVCCFRFSNWHFRCHDFGRGGCSDFGFFFDDLWLR